MAEDNTNLEEIISNWDSMDIGELGTSLLARKATMEKAAAKRAKKQEKREMAMGVLMAGQALFANGANKRIAERTAAGQLDQQNSPEQITDLKITGNIYTILDEMEKIEMPSLGSDAEAGEPPDLDTTPDASLQRDDETFDAMGEETEVMESEPSFDSFGEAFSYYRRQKRVPTFMYKGNLYTTRFKEETVPQHKKLFNVTGSYAEDYQSRTGV